MNKRKKLSILGLASAIIALSIISTAAGQANNNEVILDIEYYHQRHPYFCGPATIQIAINAIQGNAPSQFRIKNEVPFIENRGTRNIHIHIPFKNRDIEITRNGILSNQAHLRNSINKGHISIINIRFEQGRNAGHYLIVTGYNATGFYIHDHWNREFGEIQRATGENAYISNQELNSLWAYRLYWVITLAKQATNNNSIGAINYV